MIVDEQLQQLLGLRHALLRKRQQLDRRIEYLRDDGATDLATLELLDRLVTEKREVEQKSRELRARIGRLRA